MAALCIVDSTQANPREPLKIRGPLTAEDIPMLLLAELPMEDTDRQCLHACKPVSHTLVSFPRLPGLVHIVQWIWCKTEGDVMVWVSDGRCRLEQPGC